MTCRGGIGKLGRRWGWRRAELGVGWEGGMSGGGGHINRVGILWRQGHSLPGRCWRVDTRAPD